MVFFGKSPVGFFYLFTMWSLFQFNASQDSVSDRGDSFSTCSQVCCRAQTRPRCSQQWNILLPGATAWLDSSWDCAGACETDQTGKVQWKQPLIRISMITELESGSSRRSI